jgi:Polyketide cyclase / dehydrase and lipid transport
MATVYVSSVINAPIQTVWGRIRDFNALPEWHPAIADSRIEAGLPGDSVGCVRNFNLKEGGNLREQLLALSDVDHLCTYSILVSPLPVAHYVATLRLYRVTEGDRTFAEWSAAFDPVPPSAETDGVQTVTGVFRMGLESLGRHPGG